MKLRLAAGCAGSILMFAAAVAAQPAPPPPPPPADYAGDSYSQDDPGQPYEDSDAGDQGYDETGSGDAEGVDQGYGDGQPGADDGQAYSNAGEPLDGSPVDGDEAGQPPYGDEADIEPPMPADAEDPPYAYPAPGSDEPDYPPQPPLPPLPPEPPMPPEPPLPGVDEDAAGALEMREERLARTIRQGMRRGEIGAEDGYDAQRELEAIAYEREGLGRQGLLDGPELARLESRLRRLHAHVSELRRAARP